jgi:hypothetical protein
MTVRTLRIRVSAIPTSEREPTVVTRRFRFDRTNGSWAVNQTVRCLHADRAEVPRIQVSNETPQQWTLPEQFRGWQHPIHVHF